MSDYIKRDDAIEVYSELYWMHEGLLNFEEEIGKVYDEILGIPSADVVPVIRCKDCEYYHQAFCEIWSKYGTIQTREQGFCYMAERRDNEID